LEKALATMQEVAEDELDARIEDAAWEKHLAGKSRLLTREEFRR
jgi:hypothetical protein